ncbi:PepSY domain-containing protein [Paenibacillus albidus]|uniref:PepSY domain-containing protein n=1 Tax=Paenibacillus albidus TaxID=2041023 RepID=UPI001BE7AFAE|nr:PepSY domain-containing protein [Paenibacillus albidus]MBT2292771.1 PepSY domain-containing protein [Paenibacillus albidus]
MKRKLWGGITAAVILLGSAGTLGIVQGASAAAQTPETSQARIGVDKAKQFALKEVQGRIESVELETKNGKTYYEVEIEQGQRDVDVLIEAYTGKTLSVRADDDRDNDEDDRYEQSVTEASAQDKGTKITVAAAKATAVKAAGGKVVEVDLDRDNSNLKYEIEVRNGNVSAKVGIDAYTGKVLYIDRDNDNDDFDGDDFEDDRDDNGWDD